MLKNYIKTGEALPSEHGQGRRGVVRVRDRRGLYRRRSGLLRSVLVPLVGYRQGADDRDRARSSPSSPDTLTPEGALGCPNAPPF